MSVERSRQALADLVAHGELPPEGAAACARALDRVGGLCASALANPHLARQLLDELVLGAARPGTRSEAARGCGEPGVLGRAAADESDHVRLAVAINPATPSAALAGLAGDEEITVAAASAANPATPPAAVIAAVDRLVGSDGREWGPYFGVQAGLAAAVCQVHPEARMAYAASDVPELAAAACMPLGVGLEVVEAAMVIGAGRSRPRPEVGWVVAANPSVAVEACVPFVGLRHGLDKRLAGRDGVVLARSRLGRDQLVAESTASPTLAGVLVANRRLTLGARAALRRRGNQRMDVLSRLAQAGDRRASPMGDGPRRAMMLARLLVAEAAAGEPLGVSRRSMAGEHARRTTARFGHDQARWELYAGLAVVWEASHSALVEAVGDLTG